jgi:integrase
MSRRCRIRNFRVALGRISLCQRINCDTVQCITKSSHVDPGQMSVRKRKWTTRKGEVREAWIVDYVDAEGLRHIDTFARKKDADAREAQVTVDVCAGIHTPASQSITVAEAAANWIDYVERGERERSTIAQYRQHAKHINARIGGQKLSSLTTPGINKFCDDLQTTMSKAMAKKVLVSLKSLLRDAQRRGNVAQNVALSVRIMTNKRDKHKLSVGVDIPSPDEIRQIIDKASGRLRVLLITAVSTGLRASELRGLRWEDVDLKKGRLHVRQRADRYNAIGKPKSESGERTIPLGPRVLNTLKEWKLACPKSVDGLVFPTGKGNIEHHKNIMRALKPVVIAAGLTNQGGKAKYTGLHALRHFYASWCINRHEDGGLELPAKIVQERLGHASITITMDRYGHLFPSDDNGSELKEAELALLG